MKAVSRVGAEIPFFAEKGKLAPLREKNEHFWS
jgi:hypothetical protein